MEIIFAASFHLFPHTASEYRTPVIWFPVPLLKYIVAVFLPFGILQSLSEPSVLIRGMVDNQIQYDFNSHISRPLYELIQFLHGSEFRGQRTVVGYIVTIVIHRRLVYGAEPQHSNPKRLQIIQLFQNPPYIPYTVAVAVLKASGINLIHHLFLPPRFLRPDS